MTILEKISTNQLKWASESKWVIPVSLAGVKDGAVQYSVTCLNSSLGEGIEDESAIAALSYLKAEGCEDVIVSITTSLAEFNPNSKKSLTVFTLSGSFISTPIFMGAKEIVTGAAVKGEARNSHLVKSLRELKVDKTMKWKEINERLKNDIFNIRESFSV